MSPSRKHHAAAGHPDDIEAAFYEALQSGDLERLMACWADEDDVCCVLPAGPRLMGLHPIRQAFAALLAEGGVAVHVERVSKLHTMSGAVHSVLERIRLLTPEGERTAWVMATNVYFKSVQGWRMVAHHASPATAGELQALARAAPVFH